MSTRRETLSKRCENCRIHKDACICNEINHFNNKVMVSIIMHYKELPLTSNTANLTKRSLKNCEILLRGHPQAEQNKLLELKENSKPFILFPSEEATPIEEIKEKNIHLIVPDGTWRQAKKFKRRDEILKDIPCVKINSKNPSNYILRTQKDDFGLCTLEAIAYALGSLDNKAIEKGLLENLDKMVTAVLNTRKGVLTNR